MTWVVPGVTDRLGLAGAGGTPPPPASTAAATGADRPGSGGEVDAGVAGAQAADMAIPKIAAKMAMANRGKRKGSKEPIGTPLQQAYDDDTLRNSTAL